MRQRVLFISAALVLTAVSPAFSQSGERDTLIGINPVGPLFGVYSGSFQQLLGNDLGIFVRAVYFDSKWSVLYRDLMPERWSVGGELGANYYPQDSAPEGFFAGVGVASDYLFLRDAEEGLRFGVVTQIGYQVLWGPVALAPRATMGHRWVLGELERSESAADIENGSGIKGFWLGIGLDFSIAF